MQQTPPDFEDARRFMVDGQIRPNRVYDPRLLAALRSLPRERFLPPELASMAYVDRDVPVGDGRVLMEPLVIARLVQLARPRAGERALVVAAGAGYGAALLAACGAEVTAVEENPALVARARALLPLFAPGVTLVQGPLVEAGAAGGPWDIVLIEGAVTRLPGSFAGRLRMPGGRMVTVLIPERSAPEGGQGIGVMHGVVAETSSAGLRARLEFDCRTAELLSLRPAAAFVF